MTSPETVRSQSTAKTFPHPTAAVLSRLYNHSTIQLQPKVFFPAIDVIFHAVLQFPIRPQPFRLIPLKHLVYKAPRIRLIQSNFPNESTRFSNEQANCRVSPSIRGPTRNSNTYTTTTPTLPPKAPRLASIRPV